MNPKPQITGLLQRTCPALLLILAFLCASSQLAEGLENKPTHSEKELTAFLRALVDRVYEHHVVKDGKRPVFGMTYEFWREGRNYQDMGLDSLHDGAWLLAAMVTAHRADPTGKHWDRVQRYQIPFYVRMLRQSDSLFPEIRKTYEDRARLERPWRGRLPLAWDDGLGYDWVTRKQFGSPIYNTTQGPNHLAQDVANGLLAAWMESRDSSVAEALRLLHEERLANYGNIPVLAVAAGASNDKPEWLKSVRLLEFAPASTVGYAGLYSQAAEPLITYDDPLAWCYDAALVGAIETGQMDPGFVAHAAARCYGNVQTMELFYDDRPWPVGLNFFDIQEPPRFVDKKGRLNEHASTARKLMGGRGIQLAWVAAGILPELRRHPEIWENYYRNNHPNEPLVRIVDEQPVLDGERDQVYEGSARLEKDETGVTLLSGTRHLYALIESSAKETHVEIQHVGPVNGTAVRGRVVALTDGTVKATNELGEPLSLTSAFKTGEKWHVELSIPYTATPMQKQWVNGVENGRYLVRINDGPEQVIYMLSSPKRMIRRLGAYVDGTIHTWRGIWDELKVIPSGYRGTNVRDRMWEAGDAGNYAHLIRLVSLRLLDLRNGSEWNTAKVKPAATNTGS